MTDEPMQFDEVALRTMRIEDDGSMSWVTRTPPSTPDVLLVVEGFMAGVGYGVIEATDDTPELHTPLMILHFDGECGGEFCSENHSVQLVIPQSVVPAVLEMTKRVLDGEFEGEM